MNEPTPKPDSPHPGARATIIAAVIAAMATVVVGVLGYMQNAKSGQPTTVINIIVAGLQVITGQAHAVAGPDSTGQRVSRTLPLNKTTVFDGDVSVAVNAYRPPADVYLSVNGRKFGWIKPGARLTAKKDAANICYVEVIGVEAGDASGGNASFQIDYFCKALK